MTVEELQIVIEANVEQALKEFKKLIPSIQQATKQMTEQLNRVDSNSLMAKVKQAINFAKQKLLEFKKANENNKIALNVNTQEASKQVTQIQKKIDSLEKKINAKQLRLSILHDDAKAFDNKALAKRQSELPQGITFQNPEAVVHNAEIDSSDYRKIVSEGTKLEKEIEMLNGQLSEAKSKMTSLNTQTKNTGNSSSKLGSFFSVLKGKIGQAVTSVSGLKGHFSKLPSITSKITNNIKNMGSGLKQGIGHIARYALALFSLRGIYSVLSNCASSWLSSQNAGAQQLNANIEYMKNAMGTALAPIIQTVTNLVYQLMKAIQSVAYAMTGVNIFAKATASSMKSTAKSAKDTGKSLAGVHDEINNVGGNESSENGTSPNIDMASVNKLDGFSQKLYDFFRPLKDSWDTYGSGLIEQVKNTAGQVGGLISSVWGSFENTITNGTAYSILKNILSIIGNIAEAFSNAWNNDGNGDAIVQNLADAFNNILDTIDKIVQCSVFQWILDTGVGAIKALSDAVKFVTEKLSEFIGYFTGENTEKLDGWAIVIGSIATAIGLVCAALAIYNIVTGIAAVVTGLLTSPITLVILAISAVIAIIILVVQNWEWLSQKATEIFNAIADFFKNLWQGICDTIKNVWNGIKDFFSNLWNGIKDTASSIFNGIKDTISNVLNAIKTVWYNIWNGIKTVISNVWNGIWGTIRNVINSILGGIESFVNGTIKGINKLLSGISKVANAVGSLIGLNPISLQISTISLPRLAKGGVLTEATTVLAGEYSGAKTNPEIVTPQNIMEDTFDRVMSRHENNNTNQAHITVQYLGKTIFDDTVDYINEKTRRTGKDTIVTVGG